MNSTKVFSREITETDEKTTKSSSNNSGHCDAAIDAARDLLTLCGVKMLVFDVLDYDNIVVVIGLKSINLACLIRVYFPLIVAICIDLLKQC